MMVIVMVMTCTQNVYAAGTVDAAGSELILSAEEIEAKELAEGGSSFVDAQDESDGKELREDDSSNDEGAFPVSLEPAEVVDELLPGNDDVDELLPGDDDDEELSVDEEVVTDPDEEAVEEIPGEALLRESDHKHCVCGSETSCGTGHDATTEWTAWDPTDYAKLPIEKGEGNGHYYLTADVTLDQNYTAEDGVYLCLNGHTVNLNGYTYTGSGKLAITNCKGKTVGGFTCSEKSYYPNPAISGTDLELHNLSVSFSDMTGTVYGVGYEGKTGQLYLIRSRIDPAKYHICFNLRHKRWLTTSRGTYEIRDMNLVFTTDHSVYTFEIQNEADRDELMEFIQMDSGEL